MSATPQLARGSPPSGLHSPPDSNAQKNGTSDSELSDIEVEMDSVSEEEEGLKIEPNFIRDGVPVFTPDMEQFQDFEKSVNPWGMTHGIVKIVPPKEWLDNQPLLHDEVKKIKIKNPYIQEMNNQGSRGTTGNFRQLNLSSNRTYNIVEWRSLCNQLSRQPPAKRGETRRAPVKPMNLTRKKAVEIDRSADDAEAPSTAKKGKVTSSKKNKQKVEEEVSVNSRRNKYREDNSSFDDEVFKDFDYNLYEEFDDERCQDLEVAYWKHISYAPPIYGGDMPGTLFTDKTKVWDLRNLPGFLNYLDEKVPGINTTYLYVGSWKSTFSWHLEDVDLYSINFLHFGAPKQWYSISQGDRERFEKAMATKWPEEFKDCNQFLRHKTFQISPAALWKEFKIKVNKMVHRPGEFMITFPYGYHAGYNLGYNCAEAVNFAVDEWIPIAEKAKRCDCAQQQDSVWVDLNSIRKSLPRTHKWYLGDPEEEGEYYDDSENANQPTDIPTPPHSGSEVKLLAPRKRKPTPTKRENHPVKRRVAIRSPEESPCILCPNSEYELLETENGKRAHLICGEYIPETSVIHGVVRDTNFISKARMGLKCIYCRSKKGACFQCSAAKCTRAYHATCAASAGVLVQKVWVSSYGQDGTEYKEEIYDYRCRFHRPRRDKKLDEAALSEDVRTTEYGSRLRAGDICQVQLLQSDIFAGLVLSNNHSEGALILRVLFGLKNTRYEIDYKWLLIPPEESSLHKPSATAVPMPKSFKAKESLNISARQIDDLPRARDPFGKNFTWAEFNAHVIDQNPEQVKIDLTKENQIWYYLGNFSTEARAQFTEDPKEPRDNPKSHFLNTLQKPVNVVSRQSCSVSHPASRSNKPGPLIPRSTSTKPSARPTTASDSSHSERPKPSSKRSSETSRHGSEPSRSATLKCSQESHESKKNKQRAATYSLKTDPQFSHGAQASYNSQRFSLKKASISHHRHNRSENQPSSSTPKDQKSRSNLVLTQPNWPSTSLAPSSVGRSHPKSISTDNRLLSSTAAQAQNRSINKVPQSNLKLKISGTKSKSNSTPSPFTKYKYLQIEHNKDARSYKTPYRVGGGFMNGYEGSLDNLKKYCEIVGLNNISLATSSPAIKIPTLPSGALHPAIRQQYRRYQQPSPNSLNRISRINSCYEEPPPINKNQSTQSGQSSHSPKTEALNSTEEARYPKARNLLQFPLAATSSGGHSEARSRINNKYNWTKGSLDRRINSENQPTQSLVQASNKLFQHSIDVVYPNLKTVSRPLVIDKPIVPDVPPDTVTLIERMMTNLKKAVDVKNGAS